MALWGKIDNVLSTGTVSVNYDTLEVTGAATSFGQVGSAKTGDIIRFGVRDGGGTYFGDAQIVGITSATLCTIGSTMGLTGAALAGVIFEVSEPPRMVASERDGWFQVNMSFPYYVRN